jgi:hypothetical protein
MAKDPAFLFYTGDFFTGTAILSFEDKGKFIHLLCLMHQQGRMTEETIRFLVGSVSDNLKSKFKIDEKGFWFNNRLEEETEKRNKFTESRRINGLEGGRPKKIKPNGKPKKNHKVKHMDNHMEDENENVIDNKIENKKGVQGGIILPFDSSEFKNMWLAWKQYRTEIKKPYRSALSEQAALKSLSKYAEQTAIQMIEQSIANSWQGIFELKQNGKNGKQNITDADLAAALARANARQ